MRTLDGRRDRRGEQVAALAGVGGPVERASGLAHLLRRDVGLLCRGVGKLHGEVGLRRRGVGRLRGVVGSEGRLRLPT
jgi:hypothetical protein